MAEKLKKCPFCAEMVKVEAVKCKHCGSDISDTVPKKEEKKTPKWIWWLIGLFILVPIGLLLWFISIPSVIIWYLWKKSKFDKKKKIIGTVIALLFVVGIFVFNILINKPPIIIITEPESGISVEEGKINIKGTVDPVNAKIIINDKEVETTANGEFDYVSGLLVGNNTFTVSANRDSRSKRLITVNRVLSEEETEKLNLLKAQRQKEKEEKELAEKREWEQSKAGRICKTNPEWKKEECRLLADDKIWIGMHLDMLKYKMGLPDSANPSNYGRGTKWQWCWHDHKPSCYYGGNDLIIDSYN